MKAPLRVPKNYENSAFVIYYYFVPTSMFSNDFIMCIHSILATMTRHFPKLHEADKRYLRLVHQEKFLSLCQNRGVLCFPKRTVSESHILCVTRHTYTRVQRELEQRSRLLFHQPAETLYPEFSVR